MGLESWGGGEGGGGGGQMGLRVREGGRNAFIFCIHKSRQELTFLAVSWLSFDLFHQVFVYIALELSICLLYTVQCTVLPTVNVSLLLRLKLHFFVPFLVP